MFNCITDDMTPIYHIIYFVSICVMKLFENTADLGSAVFGFRIFVL